MNHWLLDGNETLQIEAIAHVDRIQLLRELSGIYVEPDYSLLKRASMILEMVVLEILQNKNSNVDHLEKDLKKIAADAFRLLQVSEVPAKPIEWGIHVLKTSALGVIADRGPDVSRWLRSEAFPILPLDSSDWGTRTWANVVDVWLRIIRKDGWDDRDLVLKRIAMLRDSQEQFEKEFLQSYDALNAKAKAIELLSLYHLAKAAETFALFITDGVVEGNYQVQRVLDSHFDRARDACRHFRLEKIEPLVAVLAASATQLVNNSIWTVTRSVNSRVTKFVESLVSRGRGNNAIFDVLPPQRRALAEKGLLGSSRRAVVVSLPTSSGKTLIAQFRILQALNQFDDEKGWVAYLAPTRTLVNQISRRLRKDFTSLDVRVEQVSPALEVDNVEASMLNESREGAFRVLVTTPEKLDLMLRQGWEQKIGRPLTLVVVDEAHNLQDAARGLKLELLLATINNECKRAQFLLLTPFIENAKEIASWLGGQSADEISWSIDWQPNDRVIGVAQPVRGNPINRKSFDYQIEMETVHTSRRTLAVNEVLNLAPAMEIANTYNKVLSQSTLAAVVAQTLQERGPVIVMHARPDWVWSLASRFMVESNKQPISSRKRLVQDFLVQEFGPEFPLIEMIDYGIGVHHAGLSDDVRAMMEWLFEEEELRFLVATTTIAQGVNFPVSGVVMASHQYPVRTPKNWVDMSSEDFWNIAGRAGRVSQGQLGVVALVADNEAKADRLKEFINRQTGELNSALVALALSARDELSNLGRIVYVHPEWSSFLQYLTHTYRQMGKPEQFASEVEQVLRSTFGFEKLRSQHPDIARDLLGGIFEYSSYLQRPGQPLKLVDSTGFSLQSIMTVLSAIGEEGVTAAVWNTSTLFESGNQDLSAMMGILLKVPELRDNLEAVTGGDSPDGDSLSSILKDWVNGSPVSEIAEKYFLEHADDIVDAMTTCGKNLFGRLTQTAAWGLGALLSITGGNMTEEQLAELRNLPSQVYYGVNSDFAVALRLLGVPRFAATQLSKRLPNDPTRSLSSLRQLLADMSDADWNDAVGAGAGAVYRSVWRTMEGLDRDSE